MENKESELMKDRYLVIADYPSNQYEIGQVINSDEWIYTTGDFYKKYPHLFKRLEWWEERTIDQMPEYVNYDGEVVKVEIWGGTMCKLENHSRFVWGTTSKATPASLADFEAHQLKTKNKEI